MSLQVISFIIIFSSFCLIVHSQTCTFDVKNLPNFAPVFITSQKQLAKNVGRFLSWKVGEKGELYCNGRDNAIASSGNKRATIQCRKDGLYVDGKKGVANIACLKDNQGEIVETKQPCINGGVFKYIGFKTMNQDFVKYITICFDNKKHSPVYSYHTVWGKGTRFTQPYEAPYFLSPGLSGINAVSVYNDQIISLKSLLGKKTRFYERKDKSPIFTKGHLVPRGDGTFKSWQIATYFFINTAPQFRDINRFNWETIETLIRGKAKILQEEIEVYTGVSGTLTLLNEDNKPVPISLKERDGEGVIPVPKWFWKIAKFKNKGIAFVTLNNPEVISTKLVCKNICKDYGWDSKHFSDFKKGYTICCTVASLMNEFPEVPQEAAVSAVLSFGNLQI